MYQNSMYQPTNYPEQNTLPQDSTYVKPNVQQNNTYMPYQQQCVPYSQTFPSSPPNDIVYQKSQVALIDYEKKRALTEHKAAVEVEIYEKKLFLHELCEEHKRYNFHEVLMNSDGEIIETNQLALPERKICNLMSPCLTRFQHNGFPSEEIYLIQGKVNDNNIDIYLNANQAGNSNYTYKKFIANRIIFKSDKLSMQKNYASQLFSLLLNSSTKTILVYDTSGWHLTDSNQFIFIPKEAPTWTELLQKAQ